MVIAFLKMNPFHHLFRKGMDDSYNPGGEYNGYVAFDKEMPLSWQGGASFEDNNALDNYVEVHGGITLDCPMEDMLDTAIIPLTAIPDPEILKGFRCIGWDTLHCDDTKERWTIEATKEETMRLMGQIEKLCNEQGR